MHLFVPAQAAAGSKVAHDEVAAGVAGVVYEAGNVAKPCRVSHPPPHRRCQLARLEHVEKPVLSVGPLPQSRLLQRDHLPHVLSHGDSRRDVLLCKDPEPLVLVHVANAQLERSPVLQLPLEGAVPGYYPRTQALRTVLVLGFAVSA